MEVQVNPNKEKSEVELKISISADEFKPYLREAAKNLSKKKSIKGFRPGKAPVDVVEEVFGTQQLLNEAIDRAIPKFFVEAVMDNNVEAIDRPAVAISEVAKEKLVFTAKVAVLPEVTLGDLSKIEVEKRDVQVDKEEVDKELKQLAKMRSQAIDVARPAEKGDSVKVDFKISVGGVLLEGGEGKEQEVHLGEGYFVPDFEQKLTGISAGDERDFTIKFPDDYGRKELQGKEAGVWVKAHAVQKKVLPKLDDDFAKGLGKFESMDHLKKEFEKNLKYEKERREIERFQGEMTEKLAENASFSVIPQALIDKEIDRLVSEFNQLMEMQQKSMEQYLEEKGRTMEQVREEMKPNAEKSVKLGLALRKFATDQDIKINEEEVEQKVNDYLKRFGSTKEAKKKIDPEELKEQLGYMLRNQRAMEALEQKITVKKADSKSEKLKTKNEK